MGDLLPLLFSYGRRDLERDIDLPGNVPSGTECDFVCVYRSQVILPEIEDHRQQLGADESLQLAIAHPIPHPRLRGDELPGRDDDYGRRRAIFQRGNRQPSGCANRADEVYVYGIGLMKQNEPACSISRLQAGS